MATQNSTTKPPPRLCHLADVHLGYRRYNKLTKDGLNQREVDVSAAFQETITRIIALKPSATVIAGDLFHSVRPSNSIITFCFRQIRRLVSETKAPVIIVGGNHEAPKRADTGSPLKLLGEIDGVFVADSSEERFTFADLGLSVTCLPHAALLQEKLPELRADDRVKYNVLAAHAQVAEKWISDFGGVDIDIRMLQPHEWNYIALGHVHLYRQVGRNGAYAGAIEHTAANIWGEARELKGFLEVDLGTEKRTFHPLTSPREVILLDAINAEGMEPDEISKQIDEKISSVPGGIEGKILKIEVNNIPREVYRYLDHKALRSYRARALNFTLDLNSSYVPGRTPDRLAGTRTTLKAELAEYCRHIELPEKDKKEIIAALEKYVREVDSKYEAA